MDDQWPFTDDFVAADDWFLSQQPFWAATIHGPDYPEADAPAERYRAHDALSTNHDQSAAALSPAYPGFSPLQPDSPAQASGSAAHTALSPSQAHDITMNYFEARNTTATNPKRRTTYLRSTCATCDAPLDTSELVLHLENPQLLCTRSQASDHLPLYCLHTGCGVKFKDLDALRQHSSISGHASVQCGVPGCITSLCTSAVEDHYIVVHSDNILYHCAQCNEGFETAKDLSNHGDGHSGAFVCEYPGCDSAATTIWDLRRHELKHRKNVQGYPCPRCPRYQGKNSFKRKDHLQQHMRNFHLVADALRRGRRGPFGCKFLSCSYSRFIHPRTLAELAVHMLEVHSSMPYVCNERGCLRTGMSGFETQSLLKLHSKNDHVSAYQCNQLGCDRVGNNGWKRRADAIKHMKKQHGIVELYD